ncbi:MAG: hypothetical protein WBZ67_14705, partial [Pseudolabrys sp.]
FDGNAAQLNSFRELEIGSLRQNITTHPIVRFGPKADKRWRGCIIRFVPCVDGSELARAFFTFAALVGAAMCSAFECGSHDRWP